MKYLPVALTFIAIASIVTPLTPIAAPGQSLAPVDSAAGGLPPALAALAARRGIAQTALPEGTAQTANHSVVRPVEESVTEPAEDSGALTLADAVATALANNLEFLAAADEVAMARETVGEALTYTSPRVKAQNFQTWVGHVTSIGGVSIGDRHTDISKIILQQALYTFGKAEAGLRLAELEGEMKRSLLESARQDLILRTVKAFAGVLKLRKSVAVAKESVEVIEKFLSQVESQYRAGVVLQTDVLATRVRLLETRQKLIEVKNAQSLALQGLCNLMGLPPDRNLDLADFPAEAPPAVPAGEAALAAAKDLPEMRQLEILKAVHSQQADLEVKMRLPSVSMQAAWESGSQFNQHDENWNATVVFEGQITDSGESRHKIRRARLAAGKTAKLLANLERGVRLSIESDLTKISETADQMALAREIIATAVANSEQTRFQYNNGLTLNTEVLNAELALSGARNGYYNSRYDNFTALADLYRQMGRMADFLGHLDRAGGEFSETGKNCFETGSEFHQNRSMK